MAFSTHQTYFWQAMHLISIYHLLFFCKRAKYIKLIDCGKKNNFRQKLVIFATFLLTGASCWHI